MASDWRTRHGMNGTRIYRVWSEMIQRCTNPNNQHWSRYGGRGIGVCSAWLGFAAFYADMGAPPEGMSIDRVNNDGNYEPGNCRWATKSQQEKNKAKKPGCASAHKGVYWVSRKRKWSAAVYFDSKRVHLGYFDSEEKAAEARNRAELARRKP